MFLCGACCATRGPDHPRAEPRSTSGETCRERTRAPHPIAEATDALDGCSRSSRRAHGGLKVQRPSGGDAHPRASPRWLTSPPRAKVQELRGEATRKSTEPYGADQLDGAADHARTGKRPSVRNGDRPVRIRVTGRWQGASGRLEVFDEQLREPRAEALLDGVVSAEADVLEEVTAEHALGRHRERREHHGEARVLERG